MRRGGWVNLGSIIGACLSAACATEAAVPWDVAAVPEDTVLAVTEDAPASDSVRWTYGGLSELRVDVVSPPAHGTLELDPDGTYTYTPAQDWYGADSFEFEVTTSEGRTSQPGLVEIDISPVEDAPTLTSIPNLTTAVNRPLQYVRFVADEGGGVLEDDQLLTATAVSSAQAPIATADIVTSFVDSGDGGIGELALVPQQDLEGTVTVTLTVDDGSGEVSRAFDIDVVAMVDPPVAYNVARTTRVNQSVDFLLWAADPVAGDPVDTWTVLSPPLHGSVTGAGPSLTYVPDAGFVGTDELTYVASDGETSNIAVVSIVVEGSALFVVADPAVITGSDVQVLSRMQAMGLDVVVADDNVVQTADAVGMDLVVLSASSGSGNINTKFRDVDVPVLTWERFLWDDMGMTATSAAPDAGIVSIDQIDIADRFHPASGGLSGTGITVFTVAANMVWGIPTADARVVATEPGGAPVVFVYEPGDALYGGLTAPAKRVGFFLPDDAGGNLAADGDWLLQCALQEALSR